MNFCGTLEEQAPVTFWVLRDEGEMLVTMPLQWIKCQGDRWCDLLTLDLHHSHFDGLEGVYIIWHLGSNPWTVYVGQGVIAERLAVHREDPEILRFKDGGLFVTWARLALGYRDGVERYLSEKLHPKVGARYPQVLPVAVNLPWD